MVDPYLVAWTDQFGALLRDKVRLMQSCIVATGWQQLAHDFDDPMDEDKFRLTYESGEYYLTNLTENPNLLVEIDIERLGVNRRP